MKTKRNIAPTDAAPTPIASAPPPVPLAAPMPPTADTQIVNVHPSRCRVCGSTDRVGYHNTVIQEFAGIADGRSYTHIVLRRTNCAGCGQARIDKTFENHPKSPDSGTK